MNPKRLASFLLLLLPRLLAAQPPVPSDADLTTPIDSASISGLSVAVVNAKGFGVREADQPGRVAEHTIYSAGSLSKVVFAYLVFKLTDEDEIELDKPFTNTPRSLLWTTPPGSQLAPACSS